MFLHFIVEVDFQLFRTFVVFGFGRIVNATVCEDSVHVSFEEMSSHVVSKTISFKKYLVVVDSQELTYRFLILSPIVFKSIGYLI